VTNNFSCKCGETITHFEERRTIGIATELDYWCQSCKNIALALPDHSVHVEENSELTFISRKQHINSYQLNWRLVMSMQLMGESQVGGSIIGMFLDLTREAFQHSWAPMDFGGMAI
jgi:hypothetical protein